MILHPAILALVAGSAVTGFMIIVASWFGLQIIRKWDLSSGSEQQLGLEKKTYLISTVMAYAFGFQIISLFLFIHTADSLCSMFTGAMCAAGTLAVNSYGYPVFILKIANFLFAGLWLTLNFTDNRAEDYPLIRKKYFLLLLIMPFVLAETVLQAVYFFSLHADVITSCCGSLFSSEGKGTVQTFLSLPVGPVRALFFALAACVTASGIYLYGTGKGAYLFSALSLLSFFVSALALMLFISLYIYEIPTHHCPFCILKREYHYIGYLMYAALLCGAVAGIGTGMLQPFRTIGSLACVVPSIQKRLALAAVILYLIFTLFSAYKMVFTTFVLE
ncbi:MAG: hypothetical protein FIA94_01595 [Nitrospirae bacterium]|nr:hypothetical protein [Nitrospirota bacterium]